MRAVNLIPVEQRRGGAGGTGRSGGAVYVLLGLLAVAVLALSAYVLTGNSVNDKQAELNGLSVKAAAAEQQAAALKPYAQFAKLEQTRVATVKSLATSRFDWDRTLRQLSKVMPSTVWLSSFLATVKPGVTVDGAGASGDTGNVRQASQSPAIELTGCTTSQDEVARLMTRLRLMSGVDHVVLTNSEKLANATAAGSAPASGADSAGAGTGDCRHGSSRFPQFSMVVLFKAPPEPAAATGAAGAAGAPAAATGRRRPSPPRRPRREAPSDPARSHRPRRRRRRRRARGVLVPRPRPPARGGLQALGAR